MYPTPTKYYNGIVAMILALIVSNSVAQDLHFSQYSHSPILLTPTETGNYFGDWRFVGNYRTQWNEIGKPINSMAVGYDRQVYIYSQKLSIGGEFVHDEGTGYRLVHQKFLLSAAYHQTVGLNTFRLGLQGGVVQKRLDNANFSYPDQWDSDNGYFNRDLPTNQTFNQNIIYYPDFNLGFAFTRRVWKLKPDVSFALFHVNRPNESFLYVKNKLKVRKVIYVKVPINLNGRWSLSPEALYMWQNKTIDFVWGSYVNYQLATNTMNAQYVFAGVSLRNAMTRNWDAFIFTGGLQFKKLRTAISYDVTVSKLRLANSYQGAFEFAIIYTGLSSVLGKRAIPCNRL